MEVGNWGTTIIKSSEFRLALGVRHVQPCGSCRELKGWEEATRTAQPWIWSVSLGNAGSQPTEQLLVTESQKSSTQHGGGRGGRQVQVASVPHSHHLPNTTASFHPSTGQWELIRLSWSRAFLFAFSYYFQRLTHNLVGRAYWTFFFFFAFSNTWY